MNLIKINCKLWVGIIKIYYYIILFLAIPELTNIVKNIIYSKKIILFLEVY